MKLLTKKQRHSVYQKTLDRVIVGKPTDIFLCNELDATLNFNLSNETLPEFMFFAPEKISWGVWFTSAEFGKERWSVRIFVLQLLIEMTKPNKTK